MQYDGAPLPPPQKALAVFTGRPGRTKEMQYWDPEVFPMCFPLLAFDGAEGWKPGILKAGIYGQAGREPPTEDNSPLDDDALARDPLTIDNLTLGRSVIHKQIFVSLRAYWRSMMQHRGTDVRGWLNSI